MKSVKIAWCLLAVTCSVAPHDLGLKIDAINKQALSLKERCFSTEKFIQCLSTNCCGSGSGESTDCACAPTAITAAETEITEPGAYCLSNNVTAITVSTNDVVIDLNSHSASTVVLGDNCVVKNGSIGTLTVGTNDTVYQVNVPTINGDGTGSSIVFIDSFNITSLEAIEHILLVRCMGYAYNSLQLRDGVKNVTLYNSYFPKLSVPETSTTLERLVLHKTVVPGVGGSGIYFENADSLKELILYQCSIGESIYIFTEAPVLERFAIEESQTRMNVSFFMTNAEPQKIAALFERCAFGEGVTVQKFDGFALRKSQLGGPLGLLTDNNVVIDNVSVVHNSGGTAITVAAGKNVLCTDCCMTATYENQLGFMTSTGPENLNIIRCYAEGCYDGFNLYSAASCLVKDCVAEALVDYGFSGGDSTVRAVGNVSLSIDALPTYNYSPGPGAPFDIDSMVTFTLSSLNDEDNTLERSAWRNLSFELKSSGGGPTT